MSWFALPSRRWFWSPALSVLLLLMATPFAASTLADEITVDNLDSAVQIRGKWSSSTTTGGFFGTDYVFRVPGDGQSSVTWPVPGNVRGRFTVFARWTSGPNRAAHAVYTVTASSGPTAITADQRSNGGSWQPLGTFDFEPNKGQGVTLTDKADGVVVADAIRFVGAPADSAPGGAAPQPTQQAAAVSQPNDSRFFAQTGYRVGEDAFWNYFSLRGGVRTFGYPVSNVFALYGMKVQIFQRQILQLRPDGGVQTMNILDEGLLPYTRMNGSTFPAPDQSVIAAAPHIDAPNYHTLTLDFVRAIAPDTFEGEKVNFASTFFGTVQPEDAYPTGVPDGAQGLLPFLNLEIWGLPTSRPMRDPTNPSFIYQRFQRGIMHYDKGCGCTQGLLLADYVKALLTGRNLPSDLAEQARSSKLLNQFKPGQPGALARPGDLPGTDLSGGFRRDATVVLDAGHGGAEIGTSHSYADGTVMTEKDLNLKIMLRLRDLLLASGYAVTPTRTRDQQVNADKKDVTGDGRVTLSDDLQARVDVANATGADVFVSVHFNGVSDPNVKGTFVFYDPDRPFADRSKALAELVDSALTRSLKDAGYVSVDHGPTRDTAVLGGDHYYLLSPQTNIVARPSNMPAVIGESLFLTNEDDANALRKDAVIEAIARGYADGIKAYFARYPVN